MIVMSKTFRGYSYDEVQYKKREWFKKQFIRGRCWVIQKEDLKSCIFYGDVKLIVKFI